MSIKLREVYRSAPNGDVWYLARNTDSGAAFVRHVPNKSSGGQAADIDLGAFLAMQDSPEKQKLLRLIGTLV